MVARRNFLTCPPWLLDRSRERPVARLADTPSFKSIVGTVGIAAIVPTLLPFLSILGIDKGTTIDVRWYAIAIVSAACVVLVAMPVWFWWFLPRSDLPFVPHWNLKHDSPGTWMLAGVGLGIFAAMCGAFCGYRVLIAAAQHIPGKHTTFEATVVESARQTGRRRRCDWRISLSEDATRDVDDFCFDPTYGSALGAHPPAVGDRVIADVVENAIGRVVVHLERT